MAKQCPKCGYVRKDGDTSPDYECPSCGIVYAKFDPDWEAEKVFARARAKLAKPVAPPSPVTLGEKDSGRDAGKSVESDRSGVHSTRKRGGLIRALGWWVLGAVVLVGAGPWLSALLPAVPISPTTTPVKAAPSKKQPPVAPPQPTPEDRAAAAAAALESRMRSQASEVCSAAIRQKAAYPSTVDIAWFLGISHHRPPGAHHLITRMEFTARNALGADLPYAALCTVSDDGKLAHFAIQRR